MCLFNIHQPSTSSSLDISSNAVLGTNKRILPKRQSKGNEMEKNKNLPLNKSKENIRKKNLKNGMLVKIIIYKIFLVLLVRQVQFKNIHLMDTSFSYFQKVSLNLLMKASS